MNSDFDLPAFLLSKLYDNMDWENGWTLADAVALAEDIRRYDGIDCDPQEIYEIMNELLAEGISIIMISSELPELLFPWMIMAGVVLAAQHGSHIAIVIVTQKLKASRRWVLAGGSLVVAVPTVETHLSRAYAKLGVRSRAQLARRLDG